ncbi:hypothetical protein B0H16DRAFT_1695398 [Mycena metata]|uniref:Uncharacterized protein n=1 Tax=Mycena metata TaxID=1033252 RepID=A0AAD7MYE3_9AGAR|nr:hypothetical protein B0H16DRAFT_1695398 [Mycena metata]
MTPTLAGLLLSALVHVEGYTSLFEVGVGSDGWTTYTESGEFEANAFGFRFSVPGEELAETCAFGADGRGTVVPLFTLAAAPTGSTSTTPPLSATASGSSPSSTPTSSTNGAVVKAFSSTKLRLRLKNSQLAFCYDLIFSVPWPGQDRGFLVCSQQALWEVEANKIKIKPIPLP